MAKKRLNVFRDLERSARALNKSLDRMIQNAEVLGKTKEVPLRELLTDEFLSECSKFKSYDDLLDSSPFKVESTEDFERIPDAEWDSYIKGNTTYPSWEEMLHKAGIAWAERKLLEGLE